MQEPDTEKPSGLTLHARHFLLPVFALLVTAGLLIQSQTRAFSWDESYHMLAAQSILGGKRPYIDFCFPQAPLNAYWNAAWMRVFGDTWRTAHAISALLTALAVLLTAAYVRRRFPVPSWQVPAAIQIVCVVGLNVLVFDYGTIGQSYGICLFLIVAAFRAAASTLDGERLILPATAGFLASAAANSSLLTAPVAPVLLVWILLYNREGGRGAKAAAFLAGVAIPCAPLVWFYLQGPRQTFFSLVEYQLRYRQVDWPGALSHDIRVLLSWLDCSQALMLGLLAAGGILFAWKGPWGQAIRAELYLCGWVSAAEIIYIANIHPNFSQYYLFALPFLAVLACAGLYALGSNLLAPDRPFWPVFLLSVMVAFGFLKSRNDERGKVTWRDAEQVARQIALLHPRGPILVDELIYFLLRYPVPSGNELSDSHKLDLPPAIMTRMHLVSKAELERRIRAGEYDVVESWANEAWKEENWIDDVGLPLVYRHQVTFGDATIFWEWAGKF